MIEAGHWSAYGVVIVADVRALESVVTGLREGQGLCARRVVVPEESVELLKETSSKDNLVTIRQNIHIESRNSNVAVASGGVCNVCHWNCDVLVGTCKLELDDPIVPE